jgi:hypothetical protein
MNTATTSAARRSKLTPPQLMTTVNIEIEVRWLEQRPYKASGKWAMRLFELRQVLKARSQNSQSSIGNNPKEAA